jgi:hypothetical protein
MKKEIYDSIKQVDALIGETYVYAVCVAIVALAIAYLIARIIKWKGGKYDSSPLKRRIWFIIIGLVGTIYFFLYNMMVVSPKITKEPLLAKFRTSNLIATLCILAIYIILGIITMLIFRRSKWGSISVFKSSN